MINNEELTHQNLYNPDNPKEVKNGSNLRIIPFLIKYSAGEITNHCCFYILSLFSCFITILCALTISSMIYNTPLIFERMAEMMNGQIDINFTPRKRESSQNEIFLDYNKINLLTENKYQINPRLIFHNAFISSVKLSNNEINSISTTELQNRFYKGQYVRKTFAFINASKEHESKIGTSFKVNQILSGEFTIPNGVAQSYNLQVGDTVIVQVNILDLISEIYAGFDSSKFTNNYYSFLGDVYQLSQLYMPLKIIAITADNGGKTMQDKDQDYSFGDYSSFFNYITKYIPFKNLNKFQKYFNSLSVTNYASEVNINLVNRNEIYANPSFNQIESQIIKIATEIIMKIGFYPIFSTYPILTILLTLNYGNVFLGIVMSLVVVILSCVSVFLIYSLLMISVESKTFDVGVFRMIGLTKTGLVELILIHSMFFIIPSLILGFSMGFLALFLLNKLFMNLLEIGIPTIPSGLSFVWGFLIGICVPILASIFPIRHALKQGLNITLDTTRSKTQGVQITYVNANSQNNWPLLGFGIVAVTYGFLLYYLLPLTLFSFNLDLLLWIMMTILIALIIGLAILALNVQTIFEKALVYLFIFWESYYQRLLVFKNLVAHKMRNRRTGIIYTVTLGFLIFVIVQYTLQIQALTIVRLKSNGAYLGVRLYDTGIGLDYNSFDKILETNPNIKDWTYVTSSLFSLININSKLLLKNVKFNDFIGTGSTAGFSANIFGVSPNFGEVIIDQFNSIFESNSSTGLSLIEQLYTPRGSQGFGTSSYVKSSLYSDLNPNNLFEIDFTGSNSDTFTYNHPIFLLDASAFFSSISPFKRSSQSVISSVPLIELMANTSSCLPNQKYTYLLIKTVDDSKDIVDAVANKLQLLIEQKQMDAILYNYYSSSSQMDKISLTLDITFDIIIAIFMFLAAFSLFSTMTANVLEQVKEVAVMRSLGITKCRLFCIYMYESMIIVLSSSIMGLFIGFLIGQTFVLQTNLFSNLPARLMFPWTQVIQIIIFSIVCAVLSTIYPVYSMVKVPVADLIKS